MPSVSPPLHRLIHLQLSSLDAGHFCKILCIDSNCLLETKHLIALTSLSSCPPSLLDSWKQDWNLTWSQTSWTLPSPEPKPANPVFTQHLIMLSLCFSASTLETPTTFSCLVILYLCARNKVCYLVAVRIWVHLTCSSLGSLELPGAQWIPAQYCDRMPLG